MIELRLCINIHVCTRAHCRSKRHLAVKHGKETKGVIVGCLPCTPGATANAFPEGQLPALAMAVAFT